MKFLIVAQRFHTNLYYRAKALQDAGHSVKVIVLYKGKSEFYEGIDLKQISLSFFSKTILKIVSLFKKQSLKSGFELRIQSPGKELRQIFKTYKPDTIILKAYQNALAVKTLAVAKKHKAKVLMLTQTTFTHIKKSKFLFRLNIKLFKFLKVYAYITPIKENYDAFQNFGIKNTFYLPFIFPVKEKIIKNGKFEEIRILSVGKFLKRKDQHLLLQSFVDLKNKGYKVKLCFIGELVNKKYLKTMLNFVNENKLSEDVRFETNFPYKKIIDEYRKHDLFVLPAYAEPAAYSPVEAMANRLPVICSDENGTKCYIENGKNGYIFKARNLNDLTEKLKQLISNRYELEKMKENALLSAKENHNPEKFTEKIIEIIK
ncbi:MAG: glycosyltransferase [Bacteroidales bacterium]|nr:glycosyltransferase [Bacteroidales bacterium]